MAKCSFAHHAATPTGSEIRLKYNFFEIHNLAKHVVVAFLIALKLINIYIL